MNLLPIGILLVGGIVLTIGDLLMKNWVEGNGSYWYVIGLFVYMIGLNFLSYSFKYKNIAVASVIFTLFNVIILALVSWLFYKEKLSGMQLLGIILGLTSVVILELGDK
jgi:multidrug transporter EmrE-like cation transporter